MTQQRVSPINVTSILPAIPLLTLNGALGQSTNLIELKNNAGAVLSKTTSAGHVYSPLMVVGLASTANPPGWLNVYSQDTTSQTVMIRAAAAQTASLTEWQNSAATVLTSINSSGHFLTPKINFTGGTTTISAFTLADGTISFEGTVGQLFSISNSLTGTIFAVNDISGLPSLEITDAGIIKLNELYGQAVFGSGTAITNAQISAIARLSTNIPLVVRGAASQSVNLSEWQGSDTFTRSFISPTAVIHARWSDAALTTAGLAVSTYGAIASVPIVVRASSGHTANLQEWQGSGGTPVAYIASNGQFANTGSGNMLTIRSSTDVANVGLFAGLSYGVRIGSLSTTASIDGVDSATGTTTYQPMRIGGSTFTAHTNNTNRLSIDSSGLATFANDVTITGNLTVNGTTTNINTTNLVVEDKNIVLGDVTTPTNTTADGGGITLKGATDKTFNWVNATSAWTSSEPIIANSFIPSSSTVPTNGMYLSASNTLNFSTNSTGNRVNIDSAGNIGIGNITAQRRLHVDYSGTAAPPLRLSNTNNNVGIEIVPNSSYYSWLVGAQYNVSNGFEITPSTAVGGTTFSTPAFVILSSGFVGIGTNSPTSILQVGGGSTYRELTIMRNIDGNTGNALLYRRSRGTQAAPTILSAQDEIGYVFFQGYDGAAYQNASSIISAVDGTAAANSMPARLTFNTTPASSVTSLERLRISSTGAISVNSTSNVLGFGSVAHQLGIVSGASTTVATVIRGAASQTANLTQWQDSTGAVLASMSSAGAFAAVTKSFDIEHPTKENMRLRYASLEGPENGVYIRGKSKERILLLPDYWIGLVYSDSITVQLTAIGSGTIYVDFIANNSIKIGGTAEEFYYFIQAERKDVDKLIVEY